MTQMIAAAVLALAPYLSTTEATKVALTDQKRAVEILRPFNDEAAKEAKSLIETLRRLEQHCNDRNLTRTQSFAVGVRGLLEGEQPNLPPGGLTIATADGTLVPTMPVTMRMEFKTAAGEVVTKAAILFVYRRAEDGWHLADVEVLSH